MNPPRSEDFQVERLGPCRFPSPLASKGHLFVDEQATVLLSCDPADLRSRPSDAQAPPSFERAGPRERIFFDPAAVGCGIVTCGGLCPGINDVIRALVLSLHYGYGVRRILGFRFGYAGLTRRGVPPLSLAPRDVEDLHHTGGTLLGSSRGPQDVAEMVETLERLGVGILFTIGGDGTLRGASAIAAEVRRRGLPIAVVGIPKTIDNDLLWVWRTFGYGTAVEAATTALVAAHNEARGAWNGIGLVKLMGRHSGFIAAEATLANCDVNFCLVPEVPFRLEGRGGFLEALERRLEEKHHALIVVAEGAGQDLLADPARAEHDASGNRKLEDVGVFLRDEIGRHLRARGVECTIKYIDPSYAIRSVPANALDSAYCLGLGQHAVHAGMTGRTDLVVGYWNQAFTHVPIPVAVAGRKGIDPRGMLWFRVLETTGQPSSLGGAGRS
jgi:6-phosphofructokinase 1